MKLLPKLPNWLKRDGNSYKQVGDTYQDIKKMWNITLDPREIIKNSRQETFKEAKERLGVSEADLDEKYKYFAYIFYLALFFTGICFIGTLYNLFIKHSLFPAVVMLSILFLCLTNAFKYSFRAFQIKHRSLCSVKEWWKRSNEWIPKIQKP